MSKRTRFNSISVTSNVIFSIIFIILALACVIPVVFVAILSITSDESIMNIGYSFIPESCSLNAYTYIFKNNNFIGRAFLVSILVTVVGTAIGMILNATMGYILSRRTYKLRKFLTYVIFIPMLFNGGLVASYLINTQFLHINNTIWALVLPLAVSSFFIIILRTFFQTTVPDAVIESGKIDGASQLRIFVNIVLPISLPALATIGLFLTFQYWNDWFMSLLYIESTHKDLYPLQFILQRIQRKIEFLTRNSLNMSAGSVVSNIPKESARMAIVLIVILPIALSYPFFQKYFISGLTIGAVKG
jgi:putative aldouronate transport system permease protein